jgi:hypothetical protein
MQIIKRLTKLLIFICPLSAAAQSTYLQQGDKGYHFVDRMEIKGGANTQLNYSTIKPYNRKAIVNEIQFLDSARQGIQTSLINGQKNPWGGWRYTKVDTYNMNSFLMNNSEFVTGSKESFKSKHPVLKTFYRTKNNLFEVNTKDFFLAINPVLQFNLSKESNNSQSLFLNTRGLTIRGMLANRIGFSSTFTDNQEQGPAYFMSLVNKRAAVPGVGFYKTFKQSGVDYFDARGYITFNATKYINIQFGHDKNFIGNGYRSLFLSEWGNSYLFLKLNTKIWKFNYQNLFMELMPDNKKTGDNLIDRKYQVMHHLSINVSKSINIGVFEAITFGRKNHFEFQYLNPIIFLRQVEGAVGSPDKAKAGFDFKINAAHKLQFYGQFLLDEFVLSRLKNDPTNYVNKYGYQLGAKYIDAFGIPNLDVQVECNRVRPFVYSHRDSVSNYTHYNQMMAHPLGANFQEFIGIIKYQPIPRLYISLKAIYYYQGLDSAGFNFGSDPFRFYSNGRPLVDPSDPLSAQRVNGFKVGGGTKATCLNASFYAAYEFRENLYLDLSIQQRNYKIANQSATNNSTLITAGIRLNIARREYDF